MIRSAPITALLGSLLGIFLQSSPLLGEVGCGMTITEDVALEKDLTCDTAAGLIVQGPNGHLNLKGHRVSCAGEQSSYGLLLTGKKATVENGQITNCQLGIGATDKGHHQIKNIVSSNHSVASFSTSGINAFIGSPGNWFMNNYAEDTPIGFMINGKSNMFIKNTSVNSSRGFVVSHTGNYLTLNTAKKNDTGFSILLGGINNHFVKNLASENTFTGFDIGGDRNKLVNNQAMKNGSSMTDVGFRVIDANENFLGWNESKFNKGIGIEVVGLFSRSTHNVLRGNLTQKNEREGIAVHILATNTMILENTSIKNGTLDLQDRHSDCDGNDWIQNTFQSSKPKECIH